MPVHRSLCVAGTMAVSETVVAWRSPTQVPVTLSVTSPTGAADTLYVATDDMLGKFAMKMWPTGTGKAFYVVYSEPNSTLNYRYVRDGDNEIGIEVVPPFDQDPPLFRSINSGAAGTAANDTITAWRHQMRETALTTVQTSMTGVIGPRASGSFQTGVEFMDFWRPYWRPLIRPSVARLKNKNVKWAQVNSIWGLINMNPPLLEQGWNSFTTEDLIGHIREIRAQGMSVALRTTAAVLDGATAQVLIAPHPREVYDLFFDELKAVLMFHAKIAQQEGVEIFIIPYSYRDPYVAANLQDEPAMKAYYNAKWKSMVAAVRSIAPSVKLSADLYQDDPAYDWQGDLDYLGDKWWVPLATTDNATVSEMYATALDKLKTYYQPISARFSNKPFLFAEVAYHSANSSAMNWLKYPADSPEMDPFRPAVAIPVSDYDEQARAYQALLLAFAATPWVQGAYSFGYQYFDLDEKGYSIRSKTAEEITSQIYQQLNGM